MYITTYSVHIVTDNYVLQVLLYIYVRLFLCCTFTKDTFYITYQRFSSFPL